MSGRNLIGIWPERVPHILAVLSGGQQQSGNLKLGSQGLPLLLELLRKAH
jgi:hypothetical protein